MKATVHDLEGRGCPQQSGRQHKKIQEVKARLFISKNGNNFGHLYVWDKSRSTRLS